MTEGVAITSAMLAPITTAVTSNVGVILPVGVGILGIMLGISLIPRIVYKFF